MPNISLPEIVEVIMDVILLSIPNPVLLGGFNIQAEAAFLGAAQDFIVSMTNIGL